MKSNVSMLFLAAMLMAVTACTRAEQLPAPVRKAKQNGVQILGKFDAPAGLQGYAARVNGRAVALYVTENGKYAIIGHMLDANGNLVSRDALYRMVIAPKAKETWAKLKASTWVPDGDPDAPQTVYVFSDPNCPYCHMFWKRSRPWVKSGQVELRHIMVGVISKTSDNKAATILTAENPEQALLKNKRQFSEGGVTPTQDIPSEIRKKLRANAMLMAELGLRGTPGIVWRDKSGRIHSLAGVPRKQGLKRIFGAR